MQNGLTCRLTNKPTVASLLHLLKVAFSLVKRGFVALLHRFPGKGKWLTVHHFNYHWPPRASAFLITLPAAL
jgi:hypothetical protein